MENNNFEKRNVDNSKTISLLKNILIGMGVVLVVLLFLYIKKSIDNKATVQQLQEYSGFVEAKKDSLEGELKGIIVQYESLRTNNDTLNSQLELQQDRIKKLLALRITDSQKIKKYESELGTIRDVLKSYIVQIDSLNTKNQILLVENKELRNTGAQLQDQNIQLSQEKEELLTITGEAKTLIAGSINVVPLNGRNREQERARYTEKIRTDFTIRKNPVADPGNKVIYLRLIRSDNVVLGSPSTGGSFSTDTQEIPFSASREVIYENNDLPVSIFWTNNGDLAKGNYTCELYNDGKMIGKTEFILK